MPPSRLPEHRHDALHGRSERSGRLGRRRARSAGDHEGKRPTRGVCAAVHDGYVPSRHDAQPVRGERSRGVQHRTDRLSRKRRQRRPVRPRASKESLEEPLKFTTAEVACPDASKVGTVTSNPAARENCTAASTSPRRKKTRSARWSPFTSWPNPKSSGCTSSSPARGRWIDNGADHDDLLGTPQVPFEDLKIKLLGGPRGTLSTPATCGQLPTELVVHAVVRRGGSDEPPPAVHDHLGRRRQPLRDPLPFAPPSRPARPTCRPAPSRPSR